MSGWQLDAFMDCVLMEVKAIFGFNSSRSNPIRLHGCDRSFVDANLLPDYTALLVFG